MLFCFPVGRRGNNFLRTVSGDLGLRSQSMTVFVNTINFPTKPRIMNTEKYPIIEIRPEWVFEVDPVV